MKSIEMKKYEITIVIDPQSVTSLGELELAGIVEEQGSTNWAGFSGAQELWQILARPYLRQLPEKIAHQSEPGGASKPHNSMEETYTNDHALQLIKACVDNDHVAFDRLYRMTCGRVNAYLCRILDDKNEIEDILTETYVAVWKNAGKFKQESMVLTWIIGIARNLAMNWLKRRKVHQALDDVPEVMTEDLTVKAMAERDRQELVHTALMNLTEQHREVLSLSLLKDFSYEDISNLLEIPVNTVKTRVFYAKSALREHLETRGVVGYDD